MRFITAYYLALIYVTVVMKPLIPFIQDAWNHQFNEIEHISLVHAKYGSNHLEKELASSASGNGKNQNQNTVRPEDQVSYHVPASECTVDFTPGNYAKKYPDFNYNFLPLICLVKQGQPPKFS